MPLDFLSESDISTLSTDFQADGTASAGDTGRVADAGHVHPAAGIGYQVVSTDFTTLAGPFTVDAPSGKVVVGGGFTLGAYESYPVQIEGSESYNPQIVQIGPAADGSSYTVNVTLQLQDDSGEPISGPYTTITVYAICVDA